MGIELLLKIAGVRILTSVISQILNHNGKSEIATIATLAGLVMVLMMVISLIGELFNEVKSIFNLSAWLKL